MVQISEELMIKFINNTCSDDELQAVNAWLNESDDNARKLFEMEQMAMFSEVSLGKDKARKERLSDKILNKIEILECERYRKSRILTIKWFSGIAAMIAVMFTIGVVLLKQPDVKMIQIAALEETQKVVLPDSSVVFLNKNSRLTYPERFASTQREVELTGEAYFNVTKDAGHPFYVKGEYLSIKVLGTRFNFISSETNNSVSLLDGSVEVSTPKQSEGVVLVPGQCANYNIQTGALTVFQTDPELDIAWHNKTIPFRNANINEIVKILNKLYNVEITVDADVDLDNTYSGVTVFYSDIDSTLTQLANVVPIRFVNRNGKVRIYPKK